MVTIRQIAERCGVSISTVSKALNDAWDISGDTAARIRAVAEELGYTPNAAARALKTRRSYSLGIYYSAGKAQGLTHEFFARILNSFKDRAENLGYDIFFIGGKLGRRSLSLDEHARYRNCDGVLIIVGTDGEAAAGAEVADTGIPTVCIDFGVDNCSCVGSDNTRGMHDLVSYVISMGHRRIAYVYGDDSYVTRTRIRSFLDTCRENGVDVPPEYLAEARYHDCSSAQEATRRLLSLPAPPTCILYPDDFSCVGGRSELESLGLSENMSFAGYDGISVCQESSPRLTTLRQDAEGMGAAAAE
ncbi:MAG: LacI family DNA-binding transcriptional regulator, partial [Oscillospiraceae bacterium]|nr:LacI family DNA-binding transcriptional regulator [Oscillospiraceae bacterium]